MTVTWAYENQVTVDSGGSSKRGKTHRGGAGRNKWTLVALNNQSGISAMRTKIYDS